MGMVELECALWVPQPEKGDCIYKCSNCGCIRDAYVLEIDNYCQNCGSKMTEGGSRMQHENFPLKVTGVCINGEEIEFLNGCSDKQEGEAMTRAEVLDKAKECVCTDREGQYGAPENNFALIAAFWNVYLESKYSEIEYSSVIEACDVAMMMALLKVARIATGKPKADNFIDLAGYAACGAEIQMKGLE